VAALWSTPRFNYIAISPALHQLEYYCIFQPYQRNAPWGAFHTIANRYKARLHSCMMYKDHADISAAGCLQCRKKHEKCDESRPLCSFCAARGLNCQYPSALKWVRRAQPTVSRHRSRKEPQEPDSAGGPSGPLSLFSGNLFQSDEEKSAWEYCMSTLCKEHGIFTLIQTRCEIGLFQRPGTRRTR
jgi:hypothetical protein